jgi:hypothetical protein
LIMLSSRRTLTGVKRFRFSATFASLALTVAVGATSVPLAGSASALPLALAKTAAMATDAIQVRDGCGRGMRFSNRRQRCVEADRDRDDDRDDRRGRGGRNGSDAGVNVLDVIIGNPGNQNRRRRDRDD